MYRERGFSLLETMIAATILAVSLLATGLLAGRALHDAASLRDHALAALLLDDIGARAELVGPDRLASDLNDGGVAGSEYRDWRENARSLLPSVRSELCRHGSPSSPGTAPSTCDGSGHLVARLTWGRPGAGATDWRQEVIRP